MIHLNNAGTSFPKPSVVSEAVTAALHAPQDAWNGIYERAHRRVCDVLGIADPERFLFTSGCTSALSVLMNDLPLGPGDRILTSSLEHHALARWLVTLKRDRGVTLAASPYAPGAPMDLDWLADTLAGGDVRLVACTMASNVTGELLPVADIVALAHQHGALCLIDAAQTAGLIPIDVDALGVDMLVFAGHKGPLGPQGIGGLYVAPGVPLVSPSAVCEVRSAHSEEPPTACAPMPSFCDVGSVNIAAAAGLDAGLAWIVERGQQTILQHVRALTAALLDGLCALPGVTVIGARSAACRTGAVSITCDTLDPSTLGQRMRDAGIVVGAGFHCAPMAHDILGTSMHGTLRLSAGPLSSRADIDAALHAIRAETTRTRADQQSQS